MGPLFSSPAVSSGPATFDALTRALDAAALRQEAVAANLANANTPGYRRRDVAFSLPAPNANRAPAPFAVALQRSDPRHRAGLALSPPDPAAGVAAHLVTDTAGAMRLDGSNVDPDAEAARLAETEITFAALTQALSSQFGALRVAITGSSSGR